MHRSIAVILVAAVSCVSAFPVLFLTYKDGDKGNPRVLDCVSPNPSSPGSYGLSFRCRPSGQTPESFALKGSDIPIFEILEEPKNDITDREIEDFSFPARLALPLFQSSKVVVQTNDPTNTHTKYEVVPEGRSGKRNQGGCADDEVFVAELDLCMPYSPQHSAPKTASVSNDQVASAVAQQHTITKVGYAKHKCPEGEMWLPSVSICAPIDNCWPCDDDDKDSGKNKRTDSDDKDSGKNKKAEDDD